MRFRQSLPTIRPFHPEANKEFQQREWRGTQGLAEDVRYYGKWMREEAWQRIGHLYPKILLSQGPGDLIATVIAWLWTRTVKCPNPACGAQMPLVRSFALSTKQGKEAYVKPIIDQAAKTVRFEVREGKDAPDGTVNRQGAKCIVCGVSSPLNYVRSEAQAGRMGAQMMAIVAEGQHGRNYLPPNEEQERIARAAEPTWKPEELVTTPSHDVDRLPMYGMYAWGDAFTPRQLVALTTFSDLVSEARNRILNDAFNIGLPGNRSGFDKEVAGAEAYADALATYLAFAVDRSANYWSSLTPWGGDFIVQTFSRQAIPIVWDFAEGNPLSDTTGNWSGAIDWITRCLQTAVPATGLGVVRQLDAATLINEGNQLLICTDPPYYDNVGYADLSDFFYVWLSST